MAKKGKAINTNHLDLRPQFVLCQVNQASPKNASVRNLDGQNRQSLVFSECRQLSQTIPQFHVERILHQRTPIPRFETQRNARRVYEDQILLCFEGEDMTANER